MEEINYAEIFDVEENAGENAPESAVPAEKTEASDLGSADQAETEGEEVREVAEPAERNAENAEKTRQSDAENRHFAAARRKAEREAEIARVIERAKKDARDEISRALQSIKLQDPYSGENIDSVEAIESIMRKAAENKRESFKKSAGMSDEDFERFLDEQPEIRAAKEARRAAQEEAARAHVEAEMKEIRRIDPALKEISDLQNTDAYPKMYELCKRGYSLSDAYKLANLDAIRTQTAAASRQAVINATAGKEHMARTESRGAGMQSVPREIRESYLAFNPAATESEIAAHYNKYIKH